MKTQLKQNALTVFLTGEIDHHAVSSIRQKIDAMLEERKITTLILDFGDVSFMDSSGIGMIIGRYKIMKARGGKMLSTGLSPAIKRIYTLGGLHRIIPIDDNGGKDGR